MNYEELPEYTGKYFAILSGEPVILIVEETYMEVVHDCGETGSGFRGNGELILDSPSKID